MSSSLSAAAFLKLIVCHNRSGRRTAARAAEARHRNQRLSAPPPTVGGEEEAEERGVGRAKGRTSAPPRCLSEMVSPSVPSHTWTRIDRPTWRGESEREGIKAKEGSLRSLLRGQIYGVVINCTHTHRSRTGRRVRMNALRGKRVWVRVTPFRLGHGTGTARCTPFDLVVIA